VGCKLMRESQNTQSLELRFRALLDEGASEVQLALSKAVFTPAPLTKQS
jgi:hypothetical protein